MLQKMMWVGVLLLGWSIAAHAQVGACPSGTIPNGNQYNMMSCAPDPNYNQQHRQEAPPPPVWADRWGAIAAGVAGSPPAFGTSENMGSESAAKEVALAKCQAAPMDRCTINMTYYDECVAYVWGDKTVSWSTAPTLVEAKQSAMKYCKASGNLQCTRYYNGCSHPIRIQ